MTDPKARREVAILIEPDLITQILTFGWGVDKPTACISGLPDGAKFVSVELSLNGYVRLVFSHPTFKHIAEDEDLPIITPRYVSGERQPAIIIHT